MASLHCERSLTLVCDVRAVHLAAISTRHKKPGHILIEIQKSPASWHFQVPRPEHETRCFTFEL